MRSFNMGSYGSDDPWFRVGTVGVNTTMAVVGMGLISMFVWAAEGPGRAVSKFLWLVSRNVGGFAGGSVLEGQVWRLLTWPIPNAPDIWTLVLFAVFFMLGSQLEADMGRKRFTAYLVAMTVIPAIIVTLYELITGTDGIIAGLRDLELGVLIGFALRHPNARFFFGIPAWAIAGVIVLLEFLRDVGNRDDHSLIVLFAIVGVSMIGIRSMGYAEEADWIPKVPLPAAYGGTMRPNTPSSKPSTSRRRRRGKANLSVAPPLGAPRKELTRLEEAEMDAILEQVSEQGLDSLTDQQRRRLEEHSKRLRRRGE